MRVTYRTQAKANASDDWASYGPAALSLDEAKNVADRAIRDGQYAARATATDSLDGKTSVKYEVYAI